MARKSRDRKKERMSTRGVALCSVVAALFLHLPILIFAPRLELIATPIFCNGEAFLKQKTYSYKPGNTTLSTEILCPALDSGEPPTPIFWPSVMASTVLFSLPLFGLGLIINRSEKLRITL